MIKMCSYPTSNKRKREMVSSLSTSNLKSIVIPTKIRKKVNNKLRRDELEYMAYSLDIGNFKYYLKKESDNLYSITKKKFFSFCGNLDYYGKDNKDTIRKILKILNNYNYELCGCDKNGNILFKYTIESFKYYVKNIFDRYKDKYGSFVIPVEYVLYFNINIRFMEDINDKDFFFDKRFNVILYFNN